MSAALEGIVLSVKDGNGVEHPIRGDAFVATALQDSLRRLNDLEWLMRALVTHNCISDPAMLDRARKLLRFEVTGESH